MKNDEEYITNEEAYRMISDKLGIPIHIVRKTIRRFFTGGGIIMHLKQQRTVSISGLGKFKTTRKGTLLKRRRENAKRLSHNRKTRKYLKEYRKKKKNL